MSDLPLDEAHQLAAQTQWLRSLARRLVGDSHAADDVVQETLLVALKAPIRGGTGENAARAWLHGIARNIVRAGRRSGARSAAREQDYGMEQPQFAPGSDEVIERTARARQLIDAVLALEEPYRTAVLLAYEERLDAPAIASRTGVSPAAARKRISRGIQQLRARLGADRGGRGHAWLIGFAGLRTSESTTPLLWITGLTMTTKWAVALFTIVALVGLGLWGLLDPGSDAPSLTSEARANANGIEAETNPLLETAESRSPAENNGRTAAPMQQAVPSTARTFVGRVLLTDDRTPVVGAEIRGNGSVASGNNNTAVGDALATTDATGHFSVELNGEIASSLLARGLWVQHADVYDVHVGAAKVSSSEGRTIEVRTVSLGDVLLRVVDAAGEPAVGIDVKYFMKPTFGSDVQLWSYQGDKRAGTTDASGELHVASLPVSTSIAFGVSGEYDTLTEVTIDPVLRRATATLQLRGWAQIVARLEWSNGAPAAGVIVNWHGAPTSSGSMGPATVTSNAEGLLSIDDVSTGGGTVHFDSRSYHAPIAARVKRGETTDLGTLTLQRPGRVAGRVILGVGTDAADSLFVSALKNGALLDEVALTESLEFSLDVPPGPVLLAVTRGIDWNPTLPYRGEFMGTATANAPSEDVEIRITTALTFLKGAIPATDAADFEARGGTVSLLPGDPNVGFGFPMRRSGLGFPPKLHPSGAFTIAMPPTPDLRVLVQDSEGRCAYSKQLAVTSGATNDVGLLDWSKSRLEVSVTDAMGAPIADAVVTTRSVDRDRSEVRTDTKGLAVFELSVGPYALRADVGDDSTGAWQLVHVESGQAAQVALRTSAAGILNGTVHSPSGPIADLSIGAQRLEPFSNLIYAASTEADGSFHFKDLLPGIYRYRVGEQLIGRVTLEPGIPADLYLSIGGAKVVIEVMRGRERLGWVGRLSAQAIGSAHAPWARGSQVGEGRFEVELPDGPLRFLVDFDGLGNNQKVLVTGPASEGSSYQLHLPPTGIEIHLEGAAAHAPIPAAFLETLGGAPASTFWGLGLELYAEDDGVGPDGVRVIRFPFVESDARVRIEGLNAQGAKKSKEARVEANGMTRVQWP